MFFYCYYFLYNLPMVKYQVNYIFKENGKSLNEVIIDGLKIVLKKEISIKFFDDFQRKLT